MANNTNNSIQEQILHIQRGMATLEREVNELVTLYERLESTQVQQGEEIGEMKVGINNVKETVQNTVLQSERNHMMIINNTDAIERVSETLKQVQLSVQSSVVENTNAMHGVTNALIALTDKINDEKFSRIEKDHAQDLELKESVSELKEIIISKTAKLPTVKKKFGGSWVELFKAIVTAPWFSIAIISALAASGLVIQTLK